MKKIVFYFFAGFFILITVSPQLQANENEVKNSGTVAIVSEMEKVNNMVERLNDIKEMDIKEMTSADKKELRKEVRSIRKDLKAIAKSDSNSEAKSVAEAEAQATRGFFISTGAAVIIVLLLILLL